MTEQDYIVRPTWDSEQRRSRGGKRYKVVRYACARCAARVAVTVEISKALGFDKSHVGFLREPCSLFLELHPDLAEQK